MAAFTKGSVVSPAEWRGTNGTMVVAVGPASLVVFVGVVPVPVAVAAVVVPATLWVVVGPVGDGYMLVFVVWVMIGGLCWGWQGT